MKHGRKLLAILLACCLTVPTVKTVYAEETAEETIQTEKPVQSEIAETTGKENTTEKTKEEKEDVTEETAESGGTASDEKQEGSEEPTGEIKPEEKAEAQSRELTGSAEATVAMQNDGSAVAEVDGQSYDSLQTALSQAQAGTVKLLTDVALTAALSAGATATLDLNGHSIVTNGLCAIKVYNGTLTVKDSTATQPTVNGKEVTGYQGGFIQARGNAINVAEGGVFYLESGKLVSTGNVAVMVNGNKAPRKDGNESLTTSYVTINGGYVVGQEGAVGALGRGATATVNGGVLEGLDNAVVAGNGSDDESRYMGGTTINIAGGTLVGHIKSSGYIACGIYHPQKGKLNISGGTIYADGGVGVLMRGGELNMTGGTVITTGSTSGKVGDSNIISDCYGVYVDGSAGYPAAKEEGFTANISGGRVGTAAGVPVVNLTNKGGVTKGTLKITGGAYSAEVPEEYLPEGSTTTKGKDNYYTLTEKKIAEINGTTYPSLQTAVTAAKSGETVKLLEDVTENITVAEDAKLTLDLNGKTLNCAAYPVSVKGDLTIENGTIARNIAGDSAPSGVVQVDGSGAKCTLNSGTIKGMGQAYGITVVGGATAVVNGGTIDSVYAALAGNNREGTMNFTVNGGTLNPKYGPAIYMPGPVSLNVTGGTLNGGISLRMGKVRISGGTINAITEKIDSPTEYYHYSGNAWLPDALYVFGGTYTSGTGNNALDLEITGGTLNCANGQGSAVAIYDLGAVEQSMTVKISGDAGLSTNATGREAYQVLGKAEVDPNNENKHYANFWKDSYTGNVDSQLSGGYYSHEAEQKYIVSGKVCSKGSYAVNGRIYSYTIGAPEKAVVVTVPGTNVGTVSDKVTDKTTAETIANHVELAGDAALTAAAAPIRDNLASKDSTVGTSKAALENQNHIILVDDAKITTSVEPYLETTVTGITKTDTEKRIELDIKMYYNIKATAVDSTNGRMTATVAEKQLMPDANVIGKELKISVKIPTGIFSETDAIFVKHTKEDGSVYNHEATLTTAATGEAEDTLTFVNKYGFSSFVIGTDTRSATVKYEDGTAAGTTVSYGPGDVGIKGLPAGPAKSGYTFKGWSLVTPGGTVLETHSGKLTDALLTRLAEVTGTIIAKPVYEEIKSNTDTTTGSSNSGSTKKHHSSGSSKTATTVKAAKTGDESNIWLPAGMLAVAVLGLGCCMVYRKKKREKAE